MQIWGQSLRYFLIIIGCVSLISCQMTNRTYIDTPRQKIAQYLTKTISDGKWKILVNAKVSSDTILVFQDATDKDVHILANDLLAECEAITNTKRVLKDCSVAYLGNEKVSFKSSSELQGDLEEYQQRPFSFLDAKKLCTYSRNMYFPYLEDIKAELSRRGKVCSSTHKVVKVDQLSKFTDAGLCTFAMKQDYTGWDERFPDHIVEAKNRGLSCNLESEEIVLLPSPDITVMQQNVPIAKDDIAIIFGNQDYKSKGQDIPNVPPARNDALAFEAYARSFLGVKKENIIHINNATSSDFERVFGNERSYKGEAFNWVREGKSNLYVYYSGHGAPGEDGTAYLIPSDASGSMINLNGYPIDTLYVNLSKIPSKSTTVILESCFSGNSQSGAVITNASPVYMKAKNTNIPINLNVITAGSANQLASWTKDKKNGLFTYHYIKGMSGDADGPEYGNENGTVENWEIKAYLEDTVTYLAKRNYGRTQNVQISIAE